MSGVLPATLRGKKFPRRGAGGSDKLQLFKIRTIFHNHLAGQDSFVLFVWDEQEDPAQVYWRAVEMRVPQDLSVFEMIIH